MKCSIFQTPVAARVKSALPDAHENATSGKTCRAGTEREEPSVFLVRTGHFLFQRIFREKLKIWIQSSQTTEQKLNYFVCGILISLKTQKDVQNSHFSKKFWTLKSLNHWKKREKKSKEPISRSEKVHQTFGKSTHWFLLCL